MKTKAVRLHGAMDVRYGEFDLPEINDNEVLLHVISDTICTSTYKAVVQGSAHKRVPDDVAENPIILGHEMCGEIAQVGKNLEGKWHVGQRVLVQPSLKLENLKDPGYSYPYIGGNSIYAVVPEVVLERGCLFPFNGDSFFSGSLVESLGCVLRGYKQMYHIDYTNYHRTDGAKKGGKVAILAGAGPMGIGAVELAIGYTGAKQVVVTDIDEGRLQDAAKKCSPEKAKVRGVSLSYVNTAGVENAAALLKEISNGGFDDVMVMAPVASLFTLAEAICAEDGCINFFAGSATHELPGTLNLYRLHYDGIKVLGTTGSVPEDTVDIIKLIEDKAIETGALISHIVGLKALPEAIYAMKKPYGAKKVCYADLDIPLVALSDFAEMGKTDPLYKNLDEIVKRNGGTWCAEAEQYLLANAPKL